MLDEPSVRGYNSTMNTPFCIHRLRTGDENKMKITGIVAEYNPFHNGHAYQIKKAREVTGCDYCIAVISGDFVQRGEVAVFSKYLRTKMALLCGADLVLEIPSIFAVSSAEDFAAGAVALLDQLGVVTIFVLAVKWEKVNVMETAAILADEPDSFSTKLKEGLSDGLSWPSGKSPGFRSRRNIGSWKLPGNA